MSFSSIIVIDDYPMFHYECSPDTRSNIPKPDSVGESALPSLSFRRVLFRPTSVSASHPIQDLTEVTFFPPREIIVGFIGCHFVCPFCDPFRAPEFRN